MATPNSDGTGEVLRGLRRYPCGADADDVTCDACPDPDNCIDRVAEAGGSVGAGDNVTFVSGIDRYPPVGTPGVVAYISDGAENPIIVDWVTGGRGSYDALDVARVEAEA